MILKGSKEKIPRNYRLKIALAMLLPFVACAIQWLLWDELSPFVWFLFFPTVFCSAWLGGLFGGILSAIISAGLVWYVFIPPQLSWTVSNFNNIYSVGMFVGMGSLFGFVFSRLEKASRQLQDSNLKITELYEKTKELDTLKTQMLSATENKYQDLFTNLTAGFALHEIILDEDGQPKDYRFLDVNPAFERLTGVKAGDIIGKTLLEVMPNSEKHWIDTYGQVAITGEPINFENYAVELGKYFNSWAYQPNPGQFAVIFYDITDRVVAEEALKRSEERFKSLIKASPTGVFQTDTAGKCIYVNEQWCTIAGMSPEEAYGDGWSSALHPDDRQMVYSAWVKAAEENSMFQLEYRFKRADGKVTWVFGQSVSLLDANGAVTGYVGTITDITAVKQALQEVVESENRFRAIVDLSPVPIAINDAEMNVTLINSAFTEAYGYTAEDIRTVDDWWTNAYPDSTYREDIKNTWQEHLKEARDGGVFKPIEATIRCKDGSTRSILSIAALIKVTGEIVVTITDLTNQINLQQDLAAAVKFAETLIDSSPISMWVSDQNGTLIRANRALYEQLQVTPEELVGTYNIFNDDEVKRHGYLEEVRRVFDEGIPVRFTISYDSSKIESLSLDRTISKVLDVTISPVIDAQGKVTNAIIQHMDISERMQIEKQLAASEENYRSFSNLTSDFVHRCTRKGTDPFRIQWVGGNIEAITGYSIEEIIASGCWLPYVHPDDKQIVADYLFSLLPGDRKSIVFRLITKQGDIHWISEENNCTAESDKGELILFGASKDITERKQFEEALKESNDRLRLISDNLPGGMTYQLDMGIDGKLRNFTYVSAGVEKLHGVTPEAVMLDSAVLYKQYLESDLTAMAQEEARALATMTPFLAEARYRTATGEIRWSFITSSPHLSPDGHLLWDGIELDITERKQLEQKIQASLLKFQSIMAASPVPKALNDNNGNITYLNPAFTTTFGYTLDDIPTLQQWWNCAYPDTDYRKYVIQKWGEHLEASQKSNAPFEPVQVRIRCKDGSDKTVIAAAAPLADNLSGEHLVVLFDISDRLELQNTETKLTTIFRTSPDVIAVTEKLTGRFIEVNAAFEKVLGFTREEAIGRTSKELGTWGNSECRQQLLDALGDGRSLMNFKTLFRRKNGEVFPALVSLELVQLGETDCLVFSARDITEQEELLRQLLEAKSMAESASRAKSEFLSNMSHEIRTPMNGIMGMAQLLQFTELDNNQKEYVESINTCSNSLLRLLNDILDLARIEAGKVELEYGDFSLYGIIGDVVTSQVSLAHTKGLPITVSISPDVPDDLIGDQLRLKQVIINLLGNAIKFTAKGGITITATLIERVENNVWIRITVNDTGIGISQENIRRIFAQFTQADASTTRKFGGTGLGLNICKRLTNLMGGSIAVESAEGVGSSFYVTIPFIVQPTSSESSDSCGEIVQQLKWDGPPVKVLIADDSPINLTVTTRFIEKLGLSAVAVQDGKQALEHWQREHFDLILMDIQMPVMDGIEAMQRIRDVEKVSGRCTPIIALTAHALKEEKDHILAQGFSGYVSKPLEIALLLDEMKRLLGYAGCRSDFTGSLTSLDTHGISREQLFSLLAEIESMLQGHSMAVFEKVSELAALMPSPAIAELKRLTRESDYRGALMSLEALKLKFDVGEVNGKQA